MIKNYKFSSYNHRIGLSKYLINKDIIKKDILDVGCGPGIITALISRNEKIRSIVCLDINKRIKKDFDKNIMKFGIKKKVKLIFSDLAKFHSKKKFDTIIAYGSFHEIKNLKLIEKLFKLLNKNGNLIISDNDLFYNLDDLKKASKNIKANKIFLNFSFIFGVHNNFGKIFSKNTESFDTPKFLPIFSSRPFFYDKIFAIITKGTYLKTKNIKLNKFDLLINAFIYKLFNFPLYLFDLIRYKLLKIFSLIIKFLK